MTISASARGSLALLLLLAACGDRNQAAPPPPAENAVSQVETLPEGQRNAVFIRALRDAGLDCQHVERSVSGGTYRQMPVWNASCSNGTEWTIVVTPSGTAQILNAEERRLIE